MSGYQHGDEQAATALFESVSPLLLRYFLAYSAHRRYGEDLVQETWIRIHRARHTYRAGEPLLPWVFAIARHTAIDYFRKARRVEVREMQVEILPEIAAQDSRLGPAEADGAPDLDAALAHLPSSQREILVMLKVTGMTIDEVARATASSAGSVKQKAHRAYRKLREVFGQRGRSK
jgi:RNA polymerase sigma-70 factor (ECF subfamily)